MEQNNIKRCPHCGEPLSWHGDYEEIELDGGEFVAFDAIEVCDNPDCDEDETDEEYAERMADYESEHFTCTCPYCFCTNPSDGVCNSCLSGAHQG